MSAVWAVVLLVGVATVAIKASGPVLLGGRPLREPVGEVVEVLAPAALAGLVVTQAVGAEGGVVLDARLAGLAAAAVGIALRAPVLAIVVAAAVATALVRLVAWPG